MDREQFEEQLNTNLSKAMALIQRKNADYASHSDPFRNFRNCELAGYDVEDGIFIRLLDKVARIGNLLRNGTLPACTDEKIEDTLLDLINYSNILLTYLQSNNTEKTEYSEDKPIS